jgi:hypothetical protein
LKHVNLDLSGVWISGIIFQLEKNLNLILKGKAMEAAGLNSLIRKSIGKISIHFDNFPIEMAEIPIFSPN